MKTVRRVGLALVWVVLGVLVGLMLPAACERRAEVPDQPDPRPVASVGLLPIDETRRDFTDRHPDGATLQIRGIEVRQRSVVLEISLINGYKDRVSLANDSFFRSREMWLVDNLGNAYRFDGKADVSVGPGEELVGSLVFLGVPPATASTVSLKTNVSDPAAAIDFDQRQRDSDVPVFFIDDIPLPEP